MENEKIKALVKEAIEEDRREHRKQILRLIVSSFLIGGSGALFFFWGLSGVIILITLFGLNNFIAGSFIGVIIGVDIWLIAYLVRCVNE